MKQEKKQRKFTKPTVAIKHKKVLAKLAENGGNLANAIRETGLYSEEVALNPQKLTNSLTWAEVVEDQLGDDLLMQKHKELLNSTRIDHLVFPLGPKKSSEKEDWLKMSGSKKAEDVLSDEEIVEMLAEVNCKVRRIVHGEQSRHVYFWSFDNKAKKEALDMAYKLKGRYKDDDNPNKMPTTTYNFIFSPNVRDKVKVIDAEIKDLLTQDVQENKTPDSSSQ